MPLEITPLNDGMQYRLTGGETFIYPLFPDENSDCEPNNFFNYAINSVEEAAFAKTTLAADQRLSDFGRQERLESISAKAVTDVARSFAGVVDYEARFDAREAAMLAMPTLDPTHFAMAVQEREIRDWWRELPMSDRTKHFALMQNEPGHDRLLFAIARSPIPLANDEAKVAREIWEARCRLDNVDEALTIERARRTVEWSKNGLLTIANLTNRVLRWQPDRVLSTIVGSDNDFARRGFKAFGFNEQQVAQAKHRLQYAKR